MTPTAISTAKERQLDWLLGDVLGGSRTEPRHRRSAVPARPWLAAAVAVFALAAAIGTALLQSHDERAAIQEPAPDVPWRECHGPGELATLPADVRALRCFDFDDAACARLVRFPELEYLDLSGTDVNDQGYSVSLQIGDDGVQALAPLTNLRWLSLATCHALRGTGLQVLEAMPRLEHLDLTYSGVESPAIERLPRLVALRSLVLSHCMNFHGRSLAAVASLPGLRRLELRACTTLAAKDVLAVVRLKELRHLDLRDCQGSFRGQTASGFDANGAEEPPPPPVQDGIGITDDVVAALAALPLQSLLLGGSESLTDAIGEPLARMTTLRVLDLSNLPKTSGALLANLPGRLESLVLDDNAQWTAAALRRLPPLPHLHELGLAALPNLDDATLHALLLGKQLHTLRVGGSANPGKVGRGDRQPPAPSLTGAAIEAITAQRQLERLAVDHDTTWLRATGFERLATMPKLRELDLTAAHHVGDAELAALAASRSLQVLDLRWCAGVRGKALATLAALPLRELNLYGTPCDAGAVRELLGRHWPACVVTMPNGTRYRAP